MSNKLTVTDSLRGDQCKQIPLRLRQDLNTWIKANTEGSVNSVLNYLVCVGVTVVVDELEEHAIFKRVNPE